mgnify:CR=1 FL=1
MERYESIVMQVDPAYENVMIKEMVMFGWNLHGRQEVRQPGEKAYVKRDIYANLFIEEEVSHYVKLHFTRSLNLPNLDEIRELEKEYFSLSPPQFPSLIPPGGIIGIIVWLCVWPV